MANLLIHENVENKRAGMQRNESFRGAARWTIVKTELAHATDPAAKST